MALWLVRRAPDRIFEGYQVVFFTLTSDRTVYYSGSGSADPTSLNN